MKTNKYFYTIITVSLNNEHGLSNTYNSVKKQSYKNYQWIVIDGDSDDGTKKFLSNIFEVENYISISEKDNGLYDAMNKGIDKAEGKYLVFMNSGDCFSDDEVLQKLHDDILSHQFPDVVYGDSYEIVNGYKKYKKSHHFKMKWYGMFAHHQSVLYKRNSVGEIRYNQNYKIAADYAFTLECINNAKNILRVDIPISIFEGGGITSKFNNNMRGIYEQMNIGIKVGNRSIFLSLLIAVLHLLKILFYRMFPSLYNFIRFKD